MATDRKDTKSRIRDTTATLLRRNGYTGTGLKQIATEASAPFGSIYHFYPGGKQQLAEETIRTVGPQYVLLFDALLASATDLLVALRQLFEAAADDLAATDFADACPIATVALEVASTNETLRRATADVFDGWIEHGTPYFTRWGIDEPSARALTITLITSLEGAFVLSRAQRSTEAITVAGEAVVAVARAALERADAPSSPSATSPPVHEVSGP